MNQCRAGGARCDLISATVPKKVHRGAGARGNCLNCVTIEHCIGSSSDRFCGKVPRPVGDVRGGLQMNSKLTKLAAAGALSLCTAVQALAGSVTQPGETVGLNTGAPLPPGWYAINT